MILNSEKREQNVRASNSPSVPFRLQRKFFELTLAVFVVLVTVVVSGTALYLLRSTINRGGVMSYPTIIVQQPTPPPLSADDLPPLYPEVIWRKPERITFQTYDSDGPSQLVGQVLTSNQVRETKLIRWQMEDYYRTYFTRTEEWEEYLLGQMPGGFLLGWKRGKQYFIVEFMGDPRGTDGFARIRHN